MKWLCPNCQAMLEVEPGEETEHLEDCKPAKKKKPQKKKKDKPGR